MNWIIILLLLGCCGNCGNHGCDCDRTRRGNEREDSKRCERSGRDCDDGWRCREERSDCDCDDCRRRQENDCSCAREAAREAVRDAREAVRDAREAVRESREQCDSQGMTPPPWQDYPSMPRRDGGRRDDCDCK